MPAFVDSNHKKSSTISSGQEVRSNSVAAPTTISAFKGNRTLTMGLWRFLVMLPVQNTDVSTLHTVIKSTYVGGCPVLGIPTPKGVSATSSTGTP